MKIASTPTPPYYAVIFTNLLNEEQEGYVEMAELMESLGQKYPDFTFIDMFLPPLQDLPDNYFENPQAAYDGSLERIMLQKYIGLYFNDYQQWFEYRRTGFPVLPKAEGMLNDQRVPVRFRYPVNAQLNNPINYQEAVARMGGDDINIKVWWER